MADTVFSKPVDGEIASLSGNITKFHAIYHKSVSKASNTANYIDTGLHGDYYIAIAAYESTGGAGAPVALGRNGNAIFAYLFRADGTAYTGAATVDVFYVLRTNIIEYVG